MNRKSDEKGSKSTSLKANTKMNPQITRVQQISIVAEMPQ
jgi:hypothetical protein